MPRAVTRYRRDVPTFAINRCPRNLAIKREVWWVRRLASRSSGGAVSNSLAVAVAEAGDGELAGEYGDEQQDGVRVDRIEARYLGSVPVPAAAQLVEFLRGHRQLDRRLTAVGQLAGVGAALVCD